VAVRGRVDLVSSPTSASKLLVVNDGHSSLTLAVTSVSSGSALHIRPSTPGEKSDVLGRVHMPLESSRTVSPLCSGLPGWNDQLHFVTAQTKSSRKGAVTLGVCYAR